MRRLNSELKKTELNLELVATYIKLVAQTSILAVKSFQHTVLPVTPQCSGYYFSQFTSNEQQLRFCEDCNSEKLRYWSLLKVLLNTALAFNHFMETSSLSWSWSSSLSASSLAILHVNVETCGITIRRLFIGTSWKLLNFLERSATLTYSRPTYLSFLV